MLSPSHQPGTVGGLTRGIVGQVEPAVGRIRSLPSDLRADATSGRALLP